MDKLVEELINGVIAYCSDHTTIERKVEPDKHKECKGCQLYDRAWFILSQEESKKKRYGHDHQPKKRYGEND